jgi:hypothetical protein
MDHRDRMETASPLRGRARFIPIDLIQADWDLFSAQSSSEAAASAS